MDQPFALVNELAGLLTLPGRNPRFPFKRYFKFLPRVFPRPKEVLRDRRPLILHTISRLHRSKLFSNSFYLQLFYATMIAYYVVGKSASAIVMTVDEVSNQSDMIRTW